MISRFMKSRIATSTPQEIEFKKRLRLICEWFDSLNGRMPSIDDADRGLPQSVIDEISAQQFDRTDLMAIRATPGKWTLRDPYKWLWILHRYQNQTNSSSNQTPNTQMSAMPKAASFKVSKEEARIIHEIAVRAARIADANNRTSVSQAYKYSILQADMDISACHANGNPLDLGGLLKAGADDFEHDVFGIRRHMDRTTGKLNGIFSHGIQSSKVRNFAQARRPPGRRAFFMQPVLRSFQRRRNNQLKTYEQKFPRPRSLLDHRQIRFERCRRQRRQKG
jgi:hypothetical protein